MMIKFMRYMLSYLVATSTATALFACNLGGHYAAGDTSDNSIRFEVVE